MSSCFEEEMKLTMGRLNRISIELSTINEIKKKEKEKNSFRSVNEEKNIITNK